MRTFRDFRCDKGHVHEAYVESEVRNKPCPVCGLDAVRMIGTPNVVLEGTSGAFPGAAMQWERKRAEKLAVERKQANS